MFLSIIIPVYNTKVYLIRECLDSLKKITLKKHQYQVIIVNDGSSDKDTINYLSEISEKFTVINKKNGGLGSARNTGIKFANGEYIFPLDSDDKIYDEFHFFIKELENNSDLDVLYGNSKKFGDENKLINQRNFNKLTLFYQRNTLQACSFFKKTIWEKVQGYDETFATIEDYDFWVRCSLNFAKFKYINYSSYEHRKILDGNSLLQRTQNIIHEYFEKIDNKLPISRREFNQMFINSFEQTSKKNIFKLINHYYFNPKKKDRPTIFLFFVNTYYTNLNNSLVITKNELEECLDFTFRRKKRKLIALALHLYLPKTYKFISKTSLFSYNYNFI